MRPPSGPTALPATAPPDDDRRDRTGRPLSRVKSDPVTATDAELIRDVRAGDNDAYGLLYERHAPAAQRFARRLAGNPHAADDALADAFTKILAAIRNGSGPTTSFRPYLFTAVRTTVIRGTRWRKRVDLTDPAGWDLPGDEATSDPADRALDPRGVRHASRAIPRRALAPRGRRPDPRRGRTDPRAVGQRRQRARLPLPGGTATGLPPRAPRPTAARRLPLGRRPAPRQGARRPDHTPAPDRRRPPPRLHALPHGRDRARRCRRRVPHGRRSAHRRRWPLVAAPPHEPRQPAGEPASGRRGGGDRRPQPRLGPAPAAPVADRTGGRDAHGHRRDAQGCRWRGRCDPGRRGEGVPISIAGAARRPAGGERPHERRPAGGADSEGADSTELRLGNTAGDQGQGVEAAADGRRLPTTPTHAPSGVPTGAGATRRTASRAGVDGSADLPGARRGRCRRGR